MQYSRVTRDQPYVSKVFVSPKGQRIKYKALNFNRLLGAGKVKKLEQGWDDRFILDYSTSHAPRLPPHAVYDSYYEEEALKYKRKRLHYRLTKPRSEVLPLLHNPQVRPLYKSNADRNHSRQFVQSKGTKNTAIRRLEKNVDSKLKSKARTMVKRSITKQVAIAELLENHELLKQKKLARWRRSYQKSIRSSPKSQHGSKSNNINKTSIFLHSVQENTASEMIKANKASKTKLTSELDHGLLIQRTNQFKTVKLDPLPQNATDMNALHKALMIVTAQRIARGFVVRIRHRRAVMQEERDNLDMLQQASMAQVKLITKSVNADSNINTGHGDKYCVAEGRESFHLVGKNSADHKRELNVVRIQKIVRGFLIRDKQNAQSLSIKRADIDSVFPADSGEVIVSNNDATTLGNLSSNEDFSSDIQCLALVAGNKSTRKSENSLKESERVAVRLMFKQIDTDNSGSIDANEMGALFSLLGYNGDASIMAAQYMVRKNISVLDFVFHAFFFFLL